MGNTVSAAEQIAAEIIRPSVVGTPVTSKYQHHHTNMKDGVPPPECPMHQKIDKKEQPVLIAECPVGYGKDDINPLNMVSASY